MDPSRCDIREPALRRDGGSSGVEFIGSLGLRMFIALARSLGRRNGKLILYAQQTFGAQVLRLAATPEGVATAFDQLRSALDTLSLSGRPRLSVELVFEEVVANVLRHGARPEGRTTICLELVLQDDAVMLTSSRTRSPSILASGPIPLRPGTSSTPRRAAGDSCSSIASARSWSTPVPRRGRIDSRSLCREMRQRGRG
jgi:hypothetical protein